VRSGTASPSSRSLPAEYPVRWESDVALSDGGITHVRPIRPDDVARLAAFHERQSSESIYYRFFSPRPKLTARDLERFTHIDYLDRMAFVALLGDDMIGMASYDRTRYRRDGELSFIVDDAHQGRGLATVLLEYLLVAARENGLSGLTAVVLPSNQRMISVLRSAGFETRSEFADGLIEVSFEIEPSPEALAAIDERARRAEARSVERLLAPATVAVIGASRTPGTIGNELLRQLLAHGFTGTVYPVNSSGGPVAGVRSYQSVLDIDDDIHLALVAVPALGVLGVVDECGSKGVEGLVILSAGFETFGPYGDTGMHLVIERARRYGMRVIGPESLGIINTSADVCLHGTFADVDIQPGRVGFLTQSGTLGLAALDHARRVGLGISAFVDVGSKIDVSGNDLVQFWEQDPSTDVIALYLESFGNPRKFTRLARRVGRTKPIVTVKSGNTGLPTDTFASRSSGPDDLKSWPVEATTDALLRQSGVIRVESPIELFDVCRLLAQQPVPAGGRVAIISNSHGALALTVDTCVGVGLELVELSERTCGLISAAALAPGALRQNPIDLTYAAGPEQYEAAIRAVIQDDAVDSLVVIYAPAFPSRIDEVADAITAAVDTTSAVTVVATFLGADIAHPPTAGSGVIPLFEFPAEAVRALAHVVDYGEWRREPEARYPRAEDHDDLDLTRAAGIVRELIGRHQAGQVDPAQDSREQNTSVGLWLDARTRLALLDALGIQIAEARLVDSADDAVQAAEELGYPVALKATGIDDLWPAEDGGVSLSLHDESSVRKAFEGMSDHFGELMCPAMVQVMVNGAELHVAAHQHAAFGGVVTVGLGGPARQAVVDAPVRVLPLSYPEARRLVSAGPIAPLLSSARGPDDPSPVEEVTGHLMRLSTVLDEIPEIADIILNPVTLTRSGAVVVDARVRVAPYRWDPAPAVRRLP